MYIRTHATQRNKNMMLLNKDKNIYENRKSFKTGEPANSGLSRMQL
jgi:hypothetical protein